MADGTAIDLRYDGAGCLARKNYPGGLENIYGYNARGQVAELVHRDAKGVLDSYRYSYDILGNKTGIEKARRGLEGESGAYTYGYDAIGRLESVSKDGSALRSYAYDAFGNRTALAEPGGVTRYAYNALNQLIAKTEIMTEPQGGIYTAPQAAARNNIQENIQLNIELNTQLSTQSNIQKNLRTETMI